MSAGLLAFLGDGTATKPMHPAWAAHGGVLAARLAAHGAEGPPGVLDGRFGLYDAFLGDRDVPLDEQLADLGSRWETLRIAYKPYPACHYMHGSIGATALVRDRVPPDEIEDILVTVPEAAVALVLEPAAAKLAPRSDYEGKFSLQYSTAALLVHGRRRPRDLLCRACSPTRPCARSPRRCATRCGRIPTYPHGVPGRREHPAARRDDASRPSSSTSSARPRTR